MSTTQIHSFLPYERGINPADIRIGSLFLDIFNIEECRESDRFEYREDLKSQIDYEKAIEPWAAEPQLDMKLGINFELSKETSMGVKFSEWIKAEGSANSTVTATLVGNEGRRLRIKKRDSFLKESVMKQDGIDKWIRTHASILRRAGFGHREFKAPEIWMVTGVQLVKNGTVHTRSSRGSKFGGGAGVDVGLAAGGPPGVAALEVEAGHENNALVGNHFGHKEERVWAAQFMQISFEFGKAPDPQDELHPKTIASFRLEDINDLRARGLRGSHEERLRIDGQPIKPPPDLIGRITVDNEKERDSDTESTGIHIDDQRYVKEMDGIDWNSYNECRKFLADAEVEREVAV